MSVAKELNGRAEADEPLLPSDGRLQGRGFSGMVSSVPGTASPAPGMDSPAPGMDSPAKVAISARVLFFCIPGFRFPSGLSTSAFSHSLEPSTIIASRITEVD